MRRVAIGLVLAAIAMAATIAIVVGGVRALREQAPSVCEEPEPPPPARPQQPAPPPAFDALACATDLRPDGHERSGPPPALRFRLYSQRELDAAAHVIAGSLPRAWHPHLELDAFGMAKQLELHIDGARPPSETAKLLDDVVHAHLCLFGVIAPAALTATGDGDIEHQGVEFDGPGIGNLYASADSEGHAYHVVFETHLWPVVDATPAIDPARMLARYVGHTYGEQTGWRYMVKPGTHIHTGCAPMLSDRTADLAAFRWHAGAVLECHGDHADVVYGARVDVAGAMRRDPALAALPTALLPDGTPVPEPRVAPAVRDVEGVDFLHDLGECPPVR